MPKDTGHGGRRPGAGRRATDTDETLTPYTLTLRLTDVGTLNRIGEGNLSRGRRAAGGLRHRGGRGRLWPPGTVSLGCAEVRAGSAVRGRVRIGDGGDSYTALKTRVNSSQTRTSRGVWDGCASPPGTPRS